MKNRMTWLRSTAAAIACVITIAYGFAGAQNAAVPAAAADGVVIQGTTKPYTHAKPNVSQYGTVLKLPVVEGQIIKQGDLLLQQDDREEKAELARLQLEANSNVRVDASDADLKIKKVQLERAQELFKSHNASRFEVEEAESKVIAAKAQADIARLELEKAKQEAIRQAAKVDKMTIKSPVTGRVEALDVTVGDITDPQKPVMTLVQNDPLKIEFYLPVAQAAKLKMDQALQLRYPSEDKWMEAVVKFKSPMADAASGQQKIGLDMRNPENRDSGMEVQVKLPADAAAAAGNAAAAAR
jgi:RND family efflux transporter MFP subunit